MIHTISPFSQRLPGDFIKQMSLDGNRNALIVRSKTGLIYYIQIMSRTLIKSAVIETVSSYKGDKTDSLTRFNWLSRMSCYCEGTAKGSIKIKDIEKEGECIMILQTGFTDKVVMVHYNKEKNVLFAAGKDGEFRVWKIPHEWRSKAIDEMETNAEYERQRQTKVSLQR